MFTYRYWYCASWMQPFILQQYSLKKPTDELAQVYQPCNMIVWKHTLEGSTTCRACGDSYKFYTCQWKKIRDRTQKLCGQFCIPDLFDELDTPALNNFILQYFTFTVVDLWHCSHQTRTPTTGSLGWPQTVCCCCCCCRYNSSYVTHPLLSSFSVQEATHTHI